MKRGGSRGQGSIDAPKLSAAPVRSSRGRGRGRPPAPVAGPSVVAPLYVHEDVDLDNDSEKENKPYNVEGVEVEEEEEGDFEWKCRLLDIIQQYPEVYDLAHPHYKDKDMCDQAWDEIATGMDATGNHLNIS